MSQKEEGLTQNFVGVKPFLIKTDSENGPLSIIWNSAAIYNFPKKLLKSK